jgi:hypothetical protein
MNFIKSHAKLAVGILALGLAAFIFFASMKLQSNLEDGTLRNWLSASDSRRAAAVEMLLGTTENSELMTACVSKMAAMPDAGNIKVRDAASLCAVGIALREKN